MDSPLETLLQECREIALDYSTIEQFPLNLSSSLLILGESSEAKDFYTYILEKYPQTSLKSHTQIKRITGNFGSYHITTQDEEFEVGQIILFYDDQALKSLKGVQSAQDFSGPEALKEAIEMSFEQNRFYSKILNFNSHRCEYHHRLLGKEICLECERVCPAWAIFKDEDKRVLSFSDLDCIDCGKCIGICPSGAIERTSYHQESLREMAKLYLGQVMLITADLPPLESIPQGIAPFLLPNLDLLNAPYLLTLIEESSSPIILHHPSPSLNECIKVINLIFEKIFKQRAIYCIDSLDMLQDLDFKPESQSNFHYPYVQSLQDSSRVIFSDRLRFLVKDEDYGKISLPHSHYGKIKINPSLCTLCNGCVEVCRTQSLRAGNFEILHQPSLCTACGYCSHICPEKAIEEDFGMIELNAQWFETSALAQDEGFACIECGKIFSNQKIIKKVKSEMLPLLNGDLLKIKALECCPDCKVKIMFEETP